MIGLTSFPYTHTHTHTHARACTHTHTHTRTESRDRAHTLTRCAQSHRTHTETVHKHTPIQTLKQYTLRQYTHSQTGHTLRQYARIVPDSTAVKPLRYCSLPGIVWNRVSIYSLFYSILTIKYINWPFLEYASRLDKGKMMLRYPRDKRYYFPTRLICLLGINIIYFSIYSYINLFLGLSVRMADIK